MKKSRLAVTAALSASVLAGSMLLASPALAADVYVPDTTKGVEGDSYPAGWFTGNPQPSTAPVDDETGITLTGKTQFLYGTNIEQLGPDSFTTLVESSGADADGTTFFQYPVFFNAGSDGDKGFTTLRPADAGAPTATGDWISSWDVKYADQVLLTKGTHTFQQVLDAFQAFVDLEATPTVLAVGVLVDTGDTALVRNISFAGDTYYFTEEPAPVDPTPEPEEPVDPTPEVPTPGTGDDDSADDAAPVATPVVTEATFTG